MPYSPRTRRHTSNTKQMKAQFILRENIKALLRTRKEDEINLARWLDHDKSWINKILNGHREMQIEDFDRVADFFGIATYQLFQPGISQVTERRSGRDRRAGRDRRVSNAQRHLASVASEIDRLRPRRPSSSNSPGGPSATRN